MMADAARAATPPAPAPEKTAEAAQGGPVSQTEDDTLSSARRGRSALRIVPAVGLNAPQG